MGDPVSIAAVAAVGSLGLKAGADVEKGYGTKAANQFQADKLTRDAEYGRNQANLTDATLNEKHNTMLGNIEAVRAAARIDPTSPTTAAIMDRESMIAERQRQAALTSIRGQISEDEASASYLKKAGDFAVMQGFLSGGVDVLGAVAQGAGPFAPKKTAA